MTQDVERIHHLVELRRWPEARALLGPLLAARPDDADLHELDAAIHDGLGDPHGVLAAASRAIALDPDREGPHRQLAHAHHELGDPAAAYRAAREAQRIAPHSWSAHTTAAMMASEAGAHEDAHAAAREALALAPGEASTHFAAGFAAQGRGRRREARRHYRRALALRPDHAEALNDLTMLRARGRPGRAMRGFAQALRVDPHDERALGNLVAVSIRVLKSVFWLGYAAAVAGIVLTGLGTSPVNLGSRVAGAVAIVAAIAILVAYAGGTSRPVRLALRRILGSQWEFWVVLAGVLLMLGFGVALCWLDGVAHAVCRFGHGFLLWLLLVMPARQLLRSRWRRARAEREATP